jgi:hypothetical protein
MLELSGRAYRQVSKDWSRAIEAADPRGSCAFYAKEKKKAQQMNLGRQFPNFYLRIKDPCWPYVDYSSMRSTMMLRRTGKQDTIVFRIL